MDNSRIVEIANGIFTEYLKENKCRRTPERFAILDAIYSINGCFEIKELMEHLEERLKFRVSRATIYNTIAMLIKANLVTHHQFEIREMLRDGEGLHHLHNVRKSYRVEQCEHN